MSGDAPACVDAVGVRHSPVSGEARIVSLVPSITELLFDLGLGPSVVGRTGYCVYPEDEVGSVLRVGGTKTADLDEIRALGATHVILNVDENPRALAEALTEIVPHVVVTHPMGLEDNPQLYRLLGTVFRRGPEAEALSIRFDHGFARLCRLAEHWPRRRVLYLIWRNPYMSVSRDTYISRTLARVGWDTVAHDSGVRYPTLEEPTKALEEADLVLFGSEPFPFKPKHIDELRRRYPMAGTQAMIIDAEMVSWYGSRAILGMDYLSAYVPEANSGDGPVS